MQLEQGESYEVLPMISRKEVKPKGAGPLTWEAKRVTKNLGTC